MPGTGQREEQLTLQLAADICFDFPLQPALIYIYMYICYPHPTLQQILIDFRLITTYINVNRMWKAFAIL